MFLKTLCQQVRIFNYFNELVFNFLLLILAGKGVHSVPPGVQPTQVLSTPYIMSNTAGMPIPYPYPYDVQFQTNPRDHGYPYAAGNNFFYKLNLIKFNI